MWFKPSSVPGPRNAVYVMLHRMLKEELPIIGRAGRGIYWRQHPPDHMLYGYPPTQSVAFVVAPQGSGWADFSALSTLGWTTQVPSRLAVAVTVRGLKPPAMHDKGRTPIYKYRPNGRRLELNWGEATLLDAARSFAASDCPTWDYAMERLVSVHPSSVDDSTIEKDKVLWAATTERFIQKWVEKGTYYSFASVVDRLKADMPDQVPVAPYG